MSNPLREALIERLGKVKGTLTTGHTWFTRPVDSRSVLAIVQIPGAESRAFLIQVSEVTERKGSSHISGSVPFGNREKLAELGRRLGNV